MHTYLWTLVCTSVSFEAGRAFQNFRWRVTMARYILTTFGKGKHRDHT